MPIPNNTAAVPGRPSSIFHGPAVSRVSEASTFNAGKRCVIYGSLLVAFSSGVVGVARVCSERVPAALDEPVADI